MHLLQPRRLLLIAAVLLACREDEVSDRVAGDAVAQVEALSDADLPEQARQLLESGRPWRAALVMRRHLKDVPTAPPEHRVLAARAEAGWGAWPAAGALLQEVRQLEKYEDGIGLYLLGRVLDARGDAAAAANNYRAFLALSSPPGRLERERAAAKLRLGLALVRTGDSIGARKELSDAAGRMGAASLWLDLLKADAFAAAGDTAAVRYMVAGKNEGVPGLRAWRARIEAARSARDLSGARELADQAHAWAKSRATRAEFLILGARVAIQMNDAATGRAALRAAIDLNAAGAHARAAAELLQAGSLTADDHLRIARVLVAQGLHQDAVGRFQKYLGGEAERAGVHMEHATALFYANRFDDVAAALRPIAGQTDARMLHARTEAHRGNGAEAARLYLALADEFPARGAQPLFLAASAHHDAGDPRAARPLYERVIARYPRTSQMGLALMRLGGISYIEGDYRAAVKTWDTYRTKYPRGANMIQATYWAARAREALKDSAGAAKLYRVVRDRERSTYYGLRASQRLGTPFWPLPMSAAVPRSPDAAQRVGQWMQGIDILANAGFVEEASAEADRVVTNAGRDRPTLYALAEALAERGYARSAVTIGLQLQGTRDPDERLLRILFPFPYRTLITEEAKSRGLDPFTVAALIRQESMFEARVTSLAGARGLMQIMPATGQTLGEGTGIEEWHAEMLFHPEINVHLGTRLMAEHIASYEGSLPSVFSAYNAGTHRVDWWKQWPEYKDDELFTERIPFAETRGYVRILTRNQAVYNGLYSR